jgi:archaellin
MKKKHITDEDLFNTFVGVLPNGKALSRVAGNELMWSYNIPVDKYRDKNLHVQMIYAMMAATTRAHYGRDAQKTPRVYINIVPRIGIPLTIEARSVSVTHPIVKRLEETFQELEINKKVIKLPKHDDVKMKPEGPANA